MQRDEHYSDLQLMDYVNRRLSDEDVIKLQQHLDICVDCRTRFDMCRAMQTVLGDKTADPPDEWVREAASLFDPNLFSETPSYVFATLTADSLTGEEQQLRSTATEERHLSFESTAYTVDLLLETSSSSLKGIVGQIIPKGSESQSEELKEVPVELRVSGRFYRTQTTELGEFLFRVDEHLDGNPVELRFRTEEGPCLALLIPC